MDLDNARDVARQLFQAGVAAADPFDGVSQALAAQTVAPDTPIIAVGKAAMRMAEAAVAAVPQPRAIIVVTNPENAGSPPAALSGAQVFAAAHPVPDGVGQAAAKAVEELLDTCGAGQEVLCLISGGGSALLPAPARGLTLQDKAKVSAQLLASGADITEMNAVRQQLSRLKGGGLLRRAAPANVRALILSDVVGDDLRTIASGPTVAAIGTAQEAKDILQRLAIWDQIPGSVRDHLSGPVPTCAKLPEATNQLIGSNSLSLRAMAAQVSNHPCHIHIPALTGDVADAAQRVASCLDKGVHLFGGETTVNVTGTGKGGRNQDLALRVALALEGQQNWVYLQAGTDGRDGPTDAAGGVVDPTTLDRIRKAGMDPTACLLNNDAYPALKAGKALLTTGGTGTNVADLGVFIRL